MLSCYTTNLIGHLRRDTPGIEDEFAQAINLSVRTDLEDGALAFTQHRRVGPLLGYSTSDTWETARKGLLEEFERNHDVIAVASTRNLPWSPTYGVEDVPHWIRLSERRGNQWRVIDEFSAVLPQGEQHPYDGWVNDEELAKMLTPLPQLTCELRNRDVHALGDTSNAPAPDCYRWLARGVDDRADHGGQWVEGAAALRYLAERFAQDPDLLRRHAQDLWAASRHYQYRFAQNASVSSAWGELPRTLSFALQSADRGRPRPALITHAFEHIVSSTLTKEGASQ